MSGDPERKPMHSRYDYDYGGRGAHSSATDAGRLADRPDRAAVHGRTERAVRASTERAGGTAMFGGRGPREDPDDRQILDDVRERLFHDSFLDPRAIELEVREGVVTLRGEVRDFMEARYAWDDAWETRGVRGVVNHLSVRTDRPSDGMRIPQSGPEV